MLPQDFVINRAKQLGVSDSELEALLPTLQGVSIRALEAQLGVNRPALQKRLGEVYRKFHISGAGPGKLAKLQQMLVTEFYKQGVASEAAAHQAEMQSQDTDVYPNTEGSGKGDRRPEWYSQLAPLFNNYERALSLAEQNLEKNYGGNVASFLQQQTLAIAKLLKDWLRRYYDDLSDLETEIASQLALQGESLTLEDLKANPIFIEDVLELEHSLRELERRSLIQLSPPKRYSLHSQVREQITHHFIAKTLNQQGYNHYLNGDLYSAKEALTEALQYQSDFTAAHYNLGSTYEQLDDIHNAKRHYEAANDTSRNASRAAINNLARLEILEGKFQKAIDRILPILEVSKSEEILSSLYKNLGWAYLCQESYDESEECLKKSLKLDKNKPTTHALFAQCLELKNKYSEALKYWSNCLKFDRSEGGKGVYWRPPELAAWIVLAHQRLQTGEQSRI